MEMERGERRVAYSTSASPYIEVKNKQETILVYPNEPHTSEVLLASGQQQLRTQAP
jgi:hypothetical protein